MMINLTNHPYDKWSNEQMEAANLFGEVIDYPFPIVSPFADEESICINADKIVEDILYTFGQAKLTIHLMGEFTMTAALLKRFQKHGITCVASTTERIATETEPGKKVVEFRFVKFRKYY